MTNTSVIPAARINVLDDSGLMTREWYRFFSGLSLLTGSGVNDISLLDLQLDPQYRDNANTSVLSLDPKPINEEFYSLSKTISNLNNFNQRNYLINGSFDIWQRGNSFSYTGASYSAYTADRWIFSFASAGSGSFTLTPYNTRADPSSGYSSSSVTVALSSATSVSFEQRIEDAATLEGKYVFASIYFAGSNVTFNIELTQNFGTGGSPSSSVTLTSSTFTSPNSAWARYGAQFRLGFSNGKTFGTNNDHYLNFKINILSGFNATIWLSDCQLEECSSTATVPSTLSKRHIGQELSLCQRYYCQVGVTPTTASIYSYTALPVTMRASPTLAVVAGSLNGATYAGSPYSSPAGMCAIRQQTNSAGAVDALLSCNAEL